MRKNVQWRVLFYCALTGMAINVSAQTWTSQTLPTSQTIRCVYFINSNEGWASGYDGIMHTTNSGSTWSTQITNSIERLLAIRFVNSNYGWANSGHRILRTENGGGMWHEMLGIDINAGIFRNTIFPVSSTVAWATAQFAPSMRWLYRYTATSSTSVTEQTYDVVGTYARLLDLWFIDQDNGWAVGEFGGITKITSGSTESPVFTDQRKIGIITSTLWGVFFLDLNKGWAVGDGGTIIKTTDGGTNWSILTSGTTTNLKDVHFMDINQGCVVGEGGLILVTTDGGANWSKQTSGVTTTLWSVNFVGSAPGFIAGGDLTNGSGTILRTDIASSVQLTRDLQTTFTLNQNFPNPFKVSTEISFYVPNNGLVSLKVYDVLGRQVAVLVEERLPPGRYTKTFYASGLQGGVYYYRLQAMELSQTRILLFQK
jgi:photosystem II stability/assembly factor-like uncharacterized protein